MNALEISWNDLGSFADGYILLVDKEPAPPYQLSERDQKFTFGPSRTEALDWIKPVNKTGWQTTNVVFDRNLLSEIDRDTKCYGYWAIHLDKNLQPSDETCNRAWPTWMNDHRDIVGKFKFRNLFILGTHDSGSYRPGFVASSNETVVTKYSLTQVSRSGS